MNTFDIETIKSTVRSHTIIPFSAKDINCDDNKLIISDRYIVNSSQQLLDKLGIRANLTKEIFANAQENWGTLRTALTNIDKSKRFSCIVSHSDNVVTFVDSKVSEPTQVNFDNRIDVLLDAINESSNTFEGIAFDSVNCAVKVNTTANEQVDCGLGDEWKFGTSVSIGNNNQQLTNYFLRLACTNGMTTKENLAYRVDNATDSIGKQFIKFISNKAFAKSIIPRVNALRNSRASLYEVNSVVDCLNKEQQELFTSFYENIKADFENANQPIANIKAKRQRFVFTNENLYDIFNLATNLATHRTDALGQKTCMSLNKVAGEIFSKGPNLQLDILDIYSKN